MPYEIRELAFKPFRPSNGSEGEMFFAAFCMKCAKDDMGKDEETGKQCRIIGDSMAYDIDDDKYPTEWTHNEKGAPVCTAFSAVEPDEPPFINLTEPLFQ